MTFRILHVLNSLEGGGAETFIMNVYRFIDKNKFQFDFLIRSTQNREDILSEIERLGGKVFITPSFPKEYWKNKIATESFWEEHGKDYVAIHVHANALLYTLPLKLSVNNEKVKTIIHSHNTKTNIPLLLPIHLFNRWRVSKLANVNLACGDEAGKWMFGKKEYCVVHNAIDVKKFSYNLCVREKIRNEFAIGENTTVVGHVGRFVSAKNHEYIVDIFEQYQKVDSNSVLLLVGGGPLENRIKEKVKELNLTKKVIFAGIREDMDAMYQAMDILLFPSLFEGLPFVLIEAQASGLKILSSKNVSNSSNVTNSITFFDLSKSAEEWARKLVELLSDEEESRYEIGQKMVGTEYDMSINVKILENIYEHSVE